MHFERAFGGSGLLLVAGLEFLVGLRQAGLRPAGEQTRRKQGQNKQHKTFFHGKVLWLQHTPASAPCEKTPFGRSGARLVGIQQILRMGGKLKRRRLRLIHRRKQVYRQRDAPCQLSPALADARACQQGEHCRRA